VECRAPLRCAACFKPGHMFRFCSTLARPRIYWRPKSTQDLRPSLESQQSSSADEESGGNSVSPPMHSTSTEKPQLLWRARLAISSRIAPIIQH
jgi:hypothetical protein